MPRLKKEVKGRKVVVEATLFALLGADRAESAGGYSSPATGVVLVLLAAAVLMMGVFPSPLLALVQ